MHADVSRALRQLPFSFNFNSSLLASSTHNSRSTPTSKFLLPFLSAALNSSRHPSPLLPFKVRSYSSDTSLGNYVHRTITPELSHTPVINAHKQDPETILLPASQVNERALPLCCPGCGALTQDEFKDEAGFYSRHRRIVQNYISQRIEDDLYNKALDPLKPEDLAAFNVDNAFSARLSSTSPKLVPEIPYCDRCHRLLHHNIGSPIAHPTLTAIEAIITESPHTSNHIWHVVDAADFPMSLILDMDKRLSLAYLRTRNRRAKDKKYTKGKQAGMSFIITRADLLAPRKEFVDAMVPKLREMLRDALGIHGKQMRLGNVHIVSAERGWWTKSVKQELLKDYGANWLVGKVNVGKSKLFETIFPKGTNTRVSAALADSSFFKTKNPIDALSTLAECNKDPASSSLGEFDAETFEEAQTEVSDKFSLLPPAQSLSQYPTMPITSGLPGTTASPIRIPFRNGKSELIDLPGLQRGNLEEFVQPNKRTELIMTSRIVPERIVVKAGASLLLGGLIRITPVHDDVTILAHAFTPLKPHLTSTLKAAAIHTGQMESGIETIVQPEVRSKMTSAGIFKLSSDITRTYAGPLVRNDAVGIRPEKLPFAIFGTDILLEGVGWVELHAQVRKPKNSAIRQQLLPPEQRVLDLELGDEVDDWKLGKYPEVEVFSPEGKCIGQRACLCAFASGGPRAVKKGARPRRSMVSVKSQRKPKKKEESY